MLTYYLYQIFKNNIEFIKILDIARYVFLFILIIIAFILPLSSSLKNKKFNKFIFFELALSSLITFVIVSLIKENYPHIRPISYFYPGEQFFDSFPSTHTSIAFAISNVILNNYLEWGIFLYLISILIGVFSWISFAHWPLDIITGAFLGFFISSIILEITKILLRVYAKDRK